MFRKLGIVALIVCAVWGLYGCGIISTQKVSRGFDIHSSDVDAIQKGTTNEHDILRLFGPPTKVRDTDSGKEYFYEYSKDGGIRWNLVFSFGGSTTTKTLLVWFDKNGVVTDYAFKKS